MAYSRYYPWLVSQFDLAGAGPTTYSYGATWDALSPTIDNEELEVWAATDRTTRGTAYTTHHARSWKVALGSLVADLNPTPVLPHYGWELTEVNLPGAVALASLYKVVRINYQATTVEARASRDAVTDATGASGGSDFYGWRYPTIQKVVWTVDLETNIPGAGPVAGFEGALAGYQIGNAGTVTIQGGPLTTFTGTAALFRSGEFNNTTEESSDHAVLRFVTLPTLTINDTSSAVNDSLLINLAYLAETFGVTMTKPGGAGHTYTGNVIITEASFESPLDNMKQGGTLTGVGALASNT